MAGVVATSLHPANLVLFFPFLFFFFSFLRSEWTQTFRGARIACASWHPSIDTLALCESCSMSLSPQAMKSSMIKDKRLDENEKEESGYDKRKIGCQLKVGFYHTPSNTGLTGYTIYNGR